MNQYIKAQAKKQLFLIATVAAVGSAALVLSTSSLALVSPVVIEDCITPASDCCNPACKPNIKQCCEANTCGLPLPVSKTLGQVEGKLVFAGQTVFCRAGY